MNNILIGSWGISSQILINAAKERWLWITVFSRENNLFSLYQEGKKVYFKSIDGGLNSSFGLKVADNKELTYTLAEDNNIRVPKNIYIDRDNLNSEYISNLDISYPVISKPVDWARWEWVSLNIKNSDELFEGLSYSFEDETVSRVVIQEELFWDDHRILIVDWKVEAVTKRIPPYVIWNGIDSLQKLIEEENNNPLRGNWWDHDAPMSKIKIDSESISFLWSLWYDMQSILKNWQELNVRKNANLSTWWLAIDLTNHIHLSIAEQAIDLARICGLWLCWVDYFCTDISEELISWEWAIIEINATPWIRMHHFPSKGQGRDIASKILQALFD
jgi:cyanophycin synthetase